MKNAGHRMRQYLQKPNMEELEKLNEACGGQVCMITVAPEEDRDQWHLSDRPARLCTVSLGHSVADYKHGTGGISRQVLPMLRICLTA